MATNLPVIAVGAEDTSDLARLVIVVNRKVLAFLLRGLATDGTASALSF